MKEDTGNDSTLLRSCEVLHYDFVVMLLLEEGACMPVHEEEKGEEESCLIFFLLTYILNLSTCLI